MINVRAIANAAIQRVNPNIDGRLLASNGYMTAASGKRIPQFHLPVNVSLQVQAVSAEDLKHVEAQNLEGVLRNVRMFGNTQGVVRPDVKGGDLLQFVDVPAGTVRNWLVVKVLETWPTWCSLIVCLQDEVP